MMFTSKTAWIPAALLALMLDGCLMSGCSVFSTGPKVATTMTEVAGSMAKSLLQAYQPEQMEADVDGEINDPTYRAVVFVGSGAFVEVVLSLQGVDLGIDIESEGEGIPVDQKLRQEAVAIIGNSQLTEEERKQAILDAIIRWLERR